MLRNIAKYFSHSCKCQAQLGKLQEYLHNKRSTILRSSETCWLEVHQRVEHVLQEWQMLKLLFLQQDMENCVVVAELFLDNMNRITEA